MFEDHYRHTTCLSCPGSDNSRLMDHRPAGRSVPSPNYMEHSSQIRYRYAHTNGANFGLPRLVTWAGSFGKDDGIFGRFVKSDVIPHHEFSWYVDLLLRPMQGVGLAMVFAERFLYILEFSTGTSYAVTVIRSTIFAFMMANPLISFFLAFLWTFDDLGVKVYDRRTGEIRLLGGSIGIILPLITGAIGILLLFRRAYVLDAVVDLIGVLMILYPPYLLFVLAHHEFILEQGATILKTLLFDTVETRLRPSQKAIA